MNRENLIIKNPESKSNPHTPKSLAKTLFLRYKLEKEPQFDKSDQDDDALYTTTYIPYGPRIHPKKLITLLTKISKSHREKFFEKNPTAKPGDYKPFFLFGSTPHIVMQGDWKPHKLQPLPSD